MKTISRQQLLELAETCFGETIPLVSGENLNIEEAFKSLQTGIASQVRSIPSEPLRFMSQSGEGELNMSNLAYK